MLFLEPKNRHFQSCPNTLCRAAENPSGNSTSESVHFPNYFVLETKTPSDLLGISGRTKVKLGGTNQDPEFSVVLKAPLPMLSLVHCQLTSELLEIPPVPPSQTRQRQQWE